MDSIVPTLLASSAVKRVYTSSGRLSATQPIDKSGYQGEDWTYSIVDYSAIYDGSGNELAYYENDTAHGSICGPNMGSSFNYGGATSNGHRCWVVHKIGRGDITIATLSVVMAYGSDKDARVYANSGQITANTRGYAEYCHVNHQAIDTNEIVQATKKSTSGVNRSRLHVPLSLWVNGMNNQTQTGFTISYEYPTEQVLYYFWYSIVGFDFNV